MTQITAVTQHCWLNNHSDIARVFSLLADGSYLTLTNKDLCRTSCLVVNSQIVTSPSSKAVVIYKVVTDYCHHYKQANSFFKASITPCSKCAGSKTIPTVAVHTRLYSSSISLRSMWRTIKCTYKLNPEKQKAAFLNVATDKILLYCSSFNCDAYSKARASSYPQVHKSSLDCLLAR